MRSAHSVWTTLGLPQLTVACAFLVYTAQAPSCSAGVQSKVGSPFCALFRSKLLRFRFSGTPQRHRLGWVCVLCLSEVRGAQATRCLASAFSQVCGVSYHLPGPGHSVSWVQSESIISGVPCVSSGELISDCDLPGACQPSRIPGRPGQQLATWSQFGRGCHLWGQDHPFPALAVARLPLCLWQGDGLVCSQLARSV